LVNPALVWILLLSSLGLVTKKPAGRMWFILGIAAALMYTSALQLPTGIPTGAASAYSISPWKVLNQSSETNQLLVDVNFLLQPSLVHLHRELNAGQIPFWNPHQAIGMTYWGNGQNAPLFPLHLIFALLPLQLGFMLLPWMRLMLAGMGSWALARVLGVREGGAIIAGLSFGLCGMMVSFSGYSMTNAVAMLPWVLWSVERIVQERFDWRWLSIIAAIQLLGGHPHTSLHTVLIMGTYLVVRGTSWRAWLHITLGWLVAAMLASIILIPTAITITDSLRYNLSLSNGAGSVPLSLSLIHLLRIVLPDLFGNPATQTWFGSANYFATNSYMGIIPLLLATLYIRVMPRERKWFAWVAVLIFCVLVAYRFPGLVDIYMQIPVLQSAPSHRLISGIMLSVAMLAGLGCDYWLHNRELPVFWSIGIVFTAVILGWLVLGDDWRQNDILQFQIMFSLGVFIILIMAVISTRISLRWRKAYIVALLLIVDVALIQGRTYPGLASESFYPKTPAIDFLQSKDERMIAPTYVLRPNTATIYGLSDLRIDDPARDEEYSRMIGSDVGNSLTTIPMNLWRNAALLDRFSVRWVMQDANTPPLQDDWMLAYDGSDARVYERPSALPMVRLTNPVNGQIDILSREAGYWEIQYFVMEPQQLVVSEFAAPGWTATINGQSYRLADEQLLTLMLPSGQGIVQLRYTPPGFIIGLLLFAIAVLMITVGTFISYQNKKG